MTRSSSGLSTTSSRDLTADGSMLEKLPVAFLAGLVSVLTPCVLPLVPGYLSAVSAVDVTGSASGARGGGSSRRACRSSPASRPCSSCSAPRRRRRERVDQRTQIEIAGFALVVLGLAFLGAAAVARADLRAEPAPPRARPRLERAPRRSVRGLRRAVYRHGARLDPRARDLVGHDRARRRPARSTYSLGLGAAFVLAGIAFAHTMRAFRLVRDHYAVVRGVSGVILVTLGLLLFFNRDWWLRVALDQVFTKIGLGSL